MASGSFFIAKTEVDTSDLVPIGVLPAVERYEALAQIVGRVAGGDVAKIFAEPVLSQGNGVAPTSISWYTSFGGEAKPLSSFAGEEREAVEGELRRALIAVAEALKDPSLGPLVGAALHIRSLDDIFVVGARPVLTNWGVAPGGARSGATDRNAHFMSTTGRFLPLDEAPPVSSEEWRSRLAGVAAALAGGAAGSSVEAENAPGVRQTEAAGGPSGGARSASVDVAALGPGGAGSGAQIPGDRASRRRWVPLVLLLALMSAALVWLLLPGTLLYPQRPAPPALSDQDAEAALRESNRARRERRDALRDAYEGAVCTPQGELVLPAPLEGRRPDGTLPPVVGPDGVAMEEQGPAEGAPDALLPPSPERVVVPEDDSAGTDPSNLLDHIEARTVLILVTSDSGGGTGTGFFIGPDLVLTNHHVLNGPPGQPIGRGREVFVANKLLGQLTPATVVAESGPVPVNGDDFALLRLSGVEMPFFTFRASDQSMRLQHVIAAGFPGTFLGRDEGWRALIRDRDISAVPEMVVTRGDVNAEQTIQGGAKTMVHSADISPGNSGGPLVDTCGRVVAVNTLLVQDENTERWLNFSLHANDALEFMSSAGVTPRTSSESCRPQVAPRASPPGAADEAAPEGSADAPDAAAAEPSNPPFETED